MDDFISHSRENNNLMPRERSYQYNNSILRIVFGNILDSSADVIVSSDDSLLTMGGGVSRAILTRGGTEILTDAAKKIPAQLGDVVVTTSGQLSQKFIFNCITIDRNKEASFSNVAIDNKSDKMQRYIVHNSVEKCFRLMSILNLSSIAFPAIGTGVAHIPYDKVAQEMSLVISEQLLRTNKSLNVELYLFDRFNKMSEKDFDVFFDTFSSILPSQTIDKTYEKSFVGISEKMKHQIFISYSRKDATSVEHICNILDGMKVSYWIDREGIYSGNNFKEVIVDAICQSDLVLYIASDNFNKSEYAFKEVSLAIKEKKAIIPICLDDSNYPKALYFDLCDVDKLNYNHCDERTIEKLKLSISFFLKRKYPTI